MAFDDMVEYYTVWAHQIKTPIAVMRLLLQAKNAIKIVNFRAAFKIDSM